MESVLGFIILKFIMWIFPLRKIEDVSKIFTQEQKSDSLPIKSDSTDVDTHTVEPPVQQTIDGKKVICLVYLPVTNMDWKIFLDVCRYQCWKFRADSTRYHWCIISCSFSSDRNYPRKVTVSPHSSHFQTTCYFLTKLFFPTCRYLTHQSWAILSILKSI